MKKILIIFTILFVCFIGYFLMIFSINPNQLVDNDPIMNQEINNDANNEQVVPNNNLLPIEFQYTNDNSMYNGIRTEIANLALNNIQSEYKITDSQLVRIDIQTAISNITDDTFNKWTNNGALNNVNIAPVGSKNSHSIDFKISNKDIKITFSFN